MARGSGILSDILALPLFLKGETDTGGAAAIADTDTDTEVDTDTDGDTSPVDPFQQAFEAAKEQHSKAEQAPPAEASTATDEKKDEKTPVAEAKVGETKTPATETGLISDAEFTALQAKHPNDPAALRKALEGAFTKKTQTLATERKSVERLQSYSDIIDAYEADPEALVEALAQQHGLKLVKAGETIADTKTVEEKKGTAAQPAPKLSAFDDPDQWSEAMAAWAKAEALRELGETTKRTVDEATKPIKDQLAKTTDRAAVEATATVMKTFETSHADWKDHEPAMMALAEKIQPNGMTELEYLDHLYETVTRPVREQTAKSSEEQRIADGVKAALDKMKKGAESAETTTRSTPEHQVRKAPQGIPTFDEAAEAAMRGERWE